MFFFFFFFLSFFFKSSADFFQNHLFRKILSGIPSECQADWIQIRTDGLSGLIWVHTVCKSYQGTTLEGKELSGTMVVLNKKFHRKILNIFLPISSNICFGFSKELSHF